MKINYIQQGGTITRFSPAALPTFIPENSLTDNIEMRVFPNPSHDEIFLVSNKNFKFTNYDIVDIMGKIIQRGQINSSGFIDIHTLSAGMYFIKVNNEDYNITLKFIKQ